MAKLSKEELLKKISEKVLDNDLSVELLEDITDSMDVSDDAEKQALQDKIAELESKLEELKAKYKERFLTNDKSEEPEEPEEPKEENIIDIKEI
ncbi:MAG: hypothetical protein MR606_05900 [Mollicutes bacterium]|nr:hypothetical protein [Mollicutes bacterium]